MKKRILVADDDAAILDALKLVLEMYDYEVIPSDGKEIPDLKEKPDLILLDIWMSGVNGKELCKKLKTNENTKNIPIMLISASRNVEQAAQEAGANGFIAKPFEIDELLNKITELT